MSDGELAARYILRHAAISAGARLLQAKCKDPLREVSDPFVRLISEHRLFKIPESARLGLLAWSRNERPVKLFFRVPRVEEVVCLQAVGRRCVSLLSPSDDPHPHADGLSFAVHDLCHLEKFMDPSHHSGQVGFFKVVARAMQKPEWQRLSTDLGPEWSKDRDYVISDMNGSVVFLLLALKSRVILHGGRSNQSTLHEWLEVLYDLLELHGPLRDSVRKLTSSTRNEVGGLIHDHFTQLGGQEGRHETHP